MCFIFYFLHRHIIKNQQHRHVIEHGILINRVHESWNIYDCKCFIQVMLPVDMRYIYVTSSGKTWVWRNKKNRLCSDAAQIARRLIRACTFYHIWAYLYRKHLCFVRNSKNNLWIRLYRNGWCKKALYSSIRPVFQMTSHYTLASKIPVLSNWCNKLDINKQARIWNPIYHITKEW